MKDLPVLISSEAEADIADARDWYRTLDPDLETRFRQAVDSCIAAIRRRPYSYPVVHRSLRRALLRRFPYFVLFTIFDDTVVVFGCIHAHRNPSDWQSRA